MSEYDAQDDGETHHFETMVDRISKAAIAPDMFIERAPEPKQEALW